jgi:hypothetical protein
MFVRKIVSVRGDALATWSWEGAVRGLGSYDRKLQQVLVLHNITSQNLKVAAKINAREFHASSCV